MATVLLVDDDENLLDALALSFEDAAYKVKTAQDGAQAWQALRDTSIDLVVSDVNMPRIDGFTLCRKMRESEDLRPLILLTSRDGEIDEALGLELGADDYLSKPFSTRILLARVAALLRRSALRKEATSDKQNSSYGAVQLNAERLELRYQGQPIKTTLTEFRLVEALLSRPGVVFSRDALLDIVRGHDSVVVDRIIDTYVRRLRRKFEEIDAQFRDIETVVGVGYKWRS